MDYKLLTSIDILGDASEQKRIGKLSLFLLVAGMLVAVGFLGETLPSLLWFTVLVVVPLPIHELVHAVFFKLFCPGTSIRFGFQSGFLFATTDGQTYPRAQMVAILLAPLLLVTPAITWAGAALGQIFAAGLAAACHVSACAGDIYFVWLAYRTQGCTHLKDTSVGIDLLQKQP